MYRETATSIPTRTRWQRFKCALGFHEWRYETYIVWCNGREDERLDTSLVHCLDCDVYARANPDDANARICLKTFPPAMDQRLYR
jgi:hypothetical protein